MSPDSPPTTPKPARHMLHKIMPELPLDDVPAGVAYYRDVLGFTINYQQHDIGVMDRDKVRLLLIARTERHRGIGSAYVYVEDADALHAELRAKGANVQGEPISEPWGLRQFHVLDLEGNQITFGQPFE
jgi:predicted enzyme related to lactoylglutathione lyase